MSSLSSSSVAASVPLAVGRPMPELVRSELSVTVVDPSCYTLPYDCSLCEALAQYCGCRVTLARSEYLSETWNWPGSFCEWKHFYTRSHQYARHSGRKWWWRHAKGVEHVINMAQFVGRLRRQQPDIVHFQWLPIPAVDSFHVRKIRGFAPTVLTLHNTGALAHGSVSRLQGSGFRRVFDNFSAVIVHSQFSKRRLLEKKWVSEDRIHVIPHGPLQYYNSEDGCHPQRSAQPQTLLFFGRIEAYKGLDVLIQAFARLPRDLINNTRLVIAGSAGFDLGPLQKLSKRLQLEERIRWEVRFIPEEEIPALFRAASVVVLPYLDIDQSGVLMTAVAFDKAIVASRIGGIAETIQDGVHGLLTEPRNVGSLTKALESVLTNAELRHSMENSVRQLRTGELSWESVAQKTFAVYRQICG